MRLDIDAVAFDIDGTLYPNAALNIRILPFILAHAPLMVRFGRVRRKIRRMQEAEPAFKKDDFFEYQASLLAPSLNLETVACRELLDRLIYDGWKPLFQRVPPFAGVRDCFDALRSAGLRLALLSDFPPEQKGDVWGLAPLCDAVLGSEHIGALKPSPLPFRVLAQALALPAHRILYVGNSIASDVIGASRAGMKTACIQSAVRIALRGPVRQADFSFSNYRQLTRYVLE